MPNCVAVPNLVEIGRNAAEIWRFFNFTRWRRRHLGFSKFDIFNGRTAEEGRTASPCQTWSKSIELRPRYGYFFQIFPRWRPSAILDLLCMCSDHPRREFDGLQRCAKFGWNECRSFGNMHVFRFHEFGLKTPIHVPKMGFFGGFDPLNGGLSHRDPQKALMVAETRRMSH